MPETICRRDLLSSICALGAAPLLAPLANASSRESRPNILFIFSDDHAAHAVSSYGSVLNQTPNMDRIANEGVRFSNAYCGNSICAPARATLLTGQHSHINGKKTNSDNLNEGYVNFPSLLQASGYQTALFGKWHIPEMPRGFDTWEILPGQGLYYNPVFRTPEGNRTYTGYTTDLITDKALNWLNQERNEDDPFLLMVHHKAPHRTWMPGPDHLDLFADEDLPEPDTLFDDYANRTSAVKEHRMGIRDHMYMAYDLQNPMSDDELHYGAYRRFMDRMTPEQKEAWHGAFGPENARFKKDPPEGDDLVRWKYQRYIKNYLRCIASVDDSIGQLLDYLDENGLAENTLVVYTSDQGFYLGDHGWYDKRWMYDESLRIPLVMRWPSMIPEGVVSDALVQNIDFAPTLLQSAGLTAHPEMQGRSLLPLMDGGTPDDWRSSIYYHYYECPSEHGVPCHYGVRTLDEKLIYYYDRDEWEYFDLKRDPDELHSTYDEPGAQPAIQTLKRELARLRAHYNDTTGKAFILDS